jgi:hypothetical protein
MYRSNIQGNMEIILRQIVEILILNKLTKIHPLKLEHLSETPFFSIVHKNQPTPKPNPQ